MKPQENGMAISPFAMVRTYVESPPISMAGYLVPSTIYIGLSTISCFEIFLLVKDQLNPWGVSITSPPLCAAVSP